MDKKDIFRCVQNKLRHSEVKLSEPQVVQDALKRYLRRIIPTHGVVLLKSRRKALVDGEKLERTGDSFIIGIKDRTTRKVDLALKFHPDNYHNSRVNCASRRLHERLAGHISPIVGHCILRGEMILGYEWTSGVTLRKHIDSIKTEEEMNKTIQSIYQLVRKIEETRRYSLAADTTDIIVPDPHAPYVLTDLNAIIQEAGRGIMPVEIYTAIQAKIRKMRWPITFNQY